MTKCCCLIILSWLFSYNCCLAQLADSVLATSFTPKRYYLVLDKPGKISRIRFYTGNRLVFKLTGEKRRYTGNISAIDKNAILILDAIIPLREIDRITIPQEATTGKFLYAFGSALRGVGGLFALIGGSNFLLTNDQKNGRITAQSGLATLGVGQLFRGFNKRTYKINKHRQLKTIEII